MSVRRVVDFPYRLSPAGLTSGGGSNMQIKQWRESAELIALIAVVGSLIAVVYELRQTQEALRSQTYQERAFDAIDMHFEIAANPGLTPRGFYTGEVSIEELPADEYESVVSLYTAMMIDLDNEHYQYQIGFLDEEFYANDTVSGIIQFAPTWRRLGMQEARQDFRAEVDRILTELPVPAEE